MLKMSRERTVFGGPAVIFKLNNLTGAGRKHRFNRQNHAGFQFQSMARIAKIVYYRVFVKFSADSVAGQTHDDINAKTFRDF